MGEPTLTKRGKVYYAWVLKPGGDNGKELLSTRCSDRKAAAARARELERRATDPGYTTEKAIDVRELVSRYVAHCEREGRAQDTVDFYETKLGHIARLVPGDACRVTREALTKYIDTRLSEGAKRVTIGKELGALRSAWRLGYVDSKVPCNGAKIIPKLSAASKPKKRFLTPEEAWAVALALPPNRAAVVMFSIATSAEFGALWRARREDVESGGGLVPVHGTKRETRDRVSPVPSGLPQAMLAWAVAHADGEGALLFRRWANIRRDLRAACELASTCGACLVAGRRTRTAGCKACEATPVVAPCSPNDLRRTYGSWLRQAGIAPQIIGAAMGHTDSRMVERVYGRLPAEDQARLIEEGLSARRAAEAPEDLRSALERLAKEHGRDALLETVSGICRVTGANRGVSERTPETENFVFLGEFGAQRRNRTADTGIFNPGRTPDFLEGSATIEGGLSGICRVTSAKRTAQPNSHGPAANSRIASTLGVALIATAAAGREEETATLARLLAGEVLGRVLTGELEADGQAASLAGEVLEEGEFALRRAIELADLVAERKLSVTAAGEERAS